MNRLGWAALAVLIPTVAAATAPTMTYNAKSGVPTRLTYVGFCDTHRLLGSVDAGAEHGTVKATQTTANFCGNPKEPVWEFVYTSNPGFKGNDQVTFYIGSQIDTVKVVVQ